ncbi:MAG: hypothetical protein ABFS41_10765 [Myxococcota bacterium]
MARELADVLHYFLDDEAAAAAPSRCLALLAEPDELLGTALLWNLGHELTRRGLSVAWVSALSDEELLPSEATGVLPRLLTPVDDLDALAAAVREAGSKAGGRQPPQLVLTRVPPSWLAASPRGTELLDWALLLTGPDADQRTEARVRLRCVAEAHPAARIGVTLHGVRSVAEAESAFTTLAHELRRHGPTPWSYGLLFEEHLLYDALLRRRPLTHHRPESRAAEAPRDVARLLHEDLRDVD